MKINYTTHYKDINPFASSLPSLNVVSYSLENAQRISAFLAIIKKNRIKTFFSFLFCLLQLLIVLDRVQFDFPAQLQYNLITHTPQRPATQAQLD